jgi:hypothetical protein
MVEVAIKIISILVNTVYQVSDTVFDVNCRVSQGLKSNHELSLDLESLLVIVLLPDRLPEIEVLDLGLKVGRRNISLIG